MSVPTRIIRCASQPPSNPPAVAKTGGIQAKSRLASSRLTLYAVTRKSVAQLVQRLYTVIANTLAITNVISLRSPTIVRTEAEASVFGCSMAGALAEIH